MGDAVESRGSRRSSSLHQTRYHDNEGRNGCEGLCSGGRHSRCPGNSGSGCQIAACNGICVMVIEE
jgi:hypothetical protein